MSEIRPLEREDIPAVASLYEVVVRSGSRQPPPALVEYFERTFWDHPWADPDIPSLVHTDADGAIVGFIGSHVRHLRFEGRSLKLACSGQLVAHPDARHMAVGALLMRKYLAGPQDLTITDGATQTVRKMWERLGGQAASISCLAWTRVFRPWRFAADQGLRRLRLGALATAGRPLWWLLDSLTRALARGRFHQPRPELRSEALSPAALLEHLPGVTGSLRLYPDYDLDFLVWLFGELERLRMRGRLVANLVSRADGETLGWYVYYLMRGGTSQVLQVAAREGAYEEVLDDLFHHAESSGSAALQGRIEPRLVEPLAGRRCFFSYSQWALVHSRDSEVLSAIGSRRALLTRLEGEWWMGHHLL